MDSSDEHNGSIRLNLSRAEALVLFDLLQRSEAEDHEYTRLGAHPAEQRVLWDTSASLERHLTEPFADDYASLLRAARAEVADDASSHRPAVRLAGQPASLRALCASGDKSLVGPSSDLRLRIRCLGIEVGEPSRWHLPRSAVKRRPSAVAIAVIATMVLGIVAVPVMLIGVFVATNGEAMAPPTQDVPRPPQWNRRAAETSVCTGSGGDFCNLVIFSSELPMTRAEAESAYVDYLQSQGWRRVDGGEGLGYQRGERNAETVLVIGSDAYLYDVQLYHEPPLISEIVVKASFADNGATRRRALGVKLVLLGAAVTAVPLVLVALRKVIRRRLKADSATSAGGSI